MESREIASLSIEPADIYLDEKRRLEGGEGEEGSQFIVALFEIPSSEMPEFYKREEEFNIVTVQAEDLGKRGKTNALACSRGSDEQFIEKWGRRHFEERYLANGISSIWNFKGKILPCRVYLRHCVLAVQKQGKSTLDDFLDNTYLFDRKTTIRKYLGENPEIMKEEPPSSLATRYNG
mmetsp:Transcript_26731/g.37294  ORF Transcript_26731/g.37294 Transcript_26731/m.37294 type:complete len:178 (+) Transcript_26731:279-812(+)